MRPPLCLSNLTLVGSAQRTPRVSPHEASDADPTLRLPPAVPGASLLARVAALAWRTLPAILDAGLTAGPLATPDADRDCSAPASATGAGARAGIARFTRGAARYPVRAAVAVGDAGGPAQLLPTVTASATRTRAVIARLIIGTARVSVCAALIIGDARTAAELVPVVARAGAVVARAVTAVVIARATSAAGAGAGVAGLTVLAVVVRAAILCWDTGFTARLVAFVARAGSVVAYLVLAALRIARVAAAFDAARTVRLAVLLGCRDEVAVLRVRLNRVFADVDQNVGVARGSRPVANGNLCGGGVRLVALALAFALRVAGLPSNDSQRGASAPSVGWNPLQEVESAYRNSVRPSLYSPDSLFAHPCDTVVARAPLMVCLPERFHRSGHRHLQFRPTPVSRNLEVLRQEVRKRRHLRG